MKKLTFLHSWVSGRNRPARRFELRPVAFIFFVIAALPLTGCVSSEVQARRDTARQDAQLASANPESPQLYRVNSGDRLRVEFFYNEELNRAVLVRPDGYISLPLIPDVLVADQTLPEIQELLAKRYAGIVKKPLVEVSLEDPGSFKIYVGGEVANPGVFALSDGVTALRAIALAGGAKQTAGLSSVVVIRDEGKPTPKYLLLDLNQSVTQLNGNQDLRLHPKDMVYIPKSKIASADQFVDQYINQLIPFQKSLNVTYLFGNPVN